MALELWFCMEKLWFYCKNCGTMEKNYGTVEKTMILYSKLLDFDLLLYWQNIVLWEKTMVL